MIKIFKGDYNKSEFYALMGKYFAEPKYRKELPYLTNKENTVWFINIVKEEVLAFGSIDESKSRVTFSEDYFEKSLKDLKTVLKSKMKYLADNKKVIDTATSNPKIAEEFLKLGFRTYKRTTNYVFLRKEVEE